MGFLTGFAVESIELVHQNEISLRYYTLGPEYRHGGARPTPLFNQVADRTLLAVSNDRAVLAIIRMEPALNRLDHVTPAYFGDIGIIARERRIARDGRIGIAARRMIDGVPVHPRTLRIVCDGAAHAVAVGHGSRHLLDHVPMLDHLAFCDAPQVDHDLPVIDRRA